MTNDCCKTACARVSINCKKIPLFFSVSKSMCYFVENELSVTMEFKLNRYFTVLCWELNHFPFEHDYDHQLWKTLAVRRAINCVLFDAKYTIGKRQRIDDCLDQEMPIFRTLRVAHAGFITWSRTPSIPLEELLESCIHVNTIMLTVLLTAVLQVVELLALWLVMCCFVVA